MLILNYIGSFTCNESASVPWGNITSDPLSWLKDWDEAIGVKEPSKMVASEVRSIYQFLLQRQSAGSPVLEWNKALERDKKIAISIGRGVEKRTRSKSPGRKNGRVVGYPQDDLSTGQHTDHSDEKEEWIHPLDANIQETDSEMEVIHPGSANGSNKKRHRDHESSSPRKKRASVMVSQQRLPNTRWVFCPSLCH